MLPLHGVSSSSDEFSDADMDENEKRDGDTEDEDMSSTDENEKDLLNDKAWGRSKNAFYDADVQDEDVFTSDDEAEDAAAEEEKEAMLLQRRLTQQLHTEDFYAIAEEESDLLSNEITVVKDLSNLSKREKLQILAEESPELLPLLDEYKEKFRELKDVYYPLMILAGGGIIKNQNGKKYIELKHQLLLNYLVNISFYLALKSSKECTKGHPVVNVLVQHQQIFSQMETFDKNLETEIHELLLKYKNAKGEFVSPNLTTISDYKAPLEASLSCIENNATLHVAEVSINETSHMNPLEYYNFVKSQHEKVKNVKKQKLAYTEEENDTNDIEKDEEGKRMITYEMSKNKGLIRNRRKELKNPRVKHKVKFKKAVIKRKGQVREVQREVSRYGGETTGIKSNLARSTKIK